MSFIIILSGVITFSANAQLAKENLYLPFGEAVETAHPLSGFVSQHKKIKLYYIKAKPSLANAVKGVENILH